MEQNLDQLEQRIEREMGLLAQLADPPAGPALLARVAAAVRAEAARTRAAPARRLPRWAALAASVLLALGLGNLFRTAQVNPPQAGHVPAAELLKAWADALERSTDRMAYLLESGGIASELADDPLEGLLDSLDSSFDAFETL